MGAVRRWRRCSRRICSTTWTGKGQPKSTAGSTVVRLAERRGAAPATMNRRISAVRGLFEFAVITGVVATSPVPSPRRTSGLRARRGLLGHVPVRHPRPGGRLVRVEVAVPGGVCRRASNEHRTPAHQRQDRLRPVLQGGRNFGLMNWPVSMATDCSSSVQRLCLRPRTFRASRLSRRRGG